MPLSRAKPLKSRYLNIVPVNLIRVTLLVLFTIPLFLFIFIPLVLIKANDNFVRKVVALKSEWINENSLEFAFVFNDIFPFAENCVEENCEEKTRFMFDNNLAKTLSYDFSGNGRLPVYFIKLKDSGTIEKLFQGGGIKEEKVDTKAEKMVVEMLTGKRDPFAFPQYHCCGGDDIVGEMPVLKSLLPPRRYLKDFPSEIEHIYIQRNSEGKILGAIVYLYGD